MVGKSAALAPMPEEAASRSGRRIEQRARKKIAPLTAYGLFVATVVVLVLCYVAQYAYVAQLNLRLARAEKELARLTAVKEQLEQEASELKSLARIEKEATQRLGLREPEEVKVVAVLPKPPVAAQTTAKSGPAPDPKSDKVTAFLNWAQWVRRALAKGISEEN
ncbi:MAG: hypothetical protein PWQ41_628 [Bacillota bacterium]|nr:hypothetical protein [Bacillota bacterium]MDK2855024.1 hypothetical protein [Bacillota bacterium]MDK2924854.1 hypothetical protein [Bacillota bacterium]